ncbi:24474_t:CDS:2, partial [Dentiscutata erythropus]
KIFWREHQHLRLPIQRSNGTMQIVGHQISREELGRRISLFPTSNKQYMVFIDSTSSSCKTRLVRCRVKRIGYALLDRFGAEIGCHIQRTIPELHHVDNYNWYFVKMSTTEEFDYDKIIQNSCLISPISTKPLSGGQI